MTNQYDTNGFEKFVTGGENSSRSWLWKQWPTSLEGLRVLDLGCGNGIDIREALARGASYVEGVDSSKKMVGEAHLNIGRNERVRVYKEDLLTASRGWESDRFGLVTSRHVLHYLTGDQLPELFAQVHRSLKMRGWFVFVVAHPMHFEESYGQGSVNLTLYGKVPVSFYSHQLSDYMGEHFLSRFVLTAFKEGVGPEASPLNEQPFYWLGISARKK